MVCSLSSSETVHYGYKRYTQEAWIELDTISVLDVLHKWSNYACSFDMHASRGQRLLIKNNAITKEFKANIRTLNPALSFISMNTDLDRGYINEEHDAYASRIHESVHHLIRPELISDLNNIIRQSRFAQIYIFDSANELQNQMKVGVNPDVCPGTCMQLLQDMMIY